VYRKIGLVTDSTSDLPPALAEAQGLYIVPQRILWNGYSYRDGLDLTPEMFYRMLGETDTLPETEPPTPEDFADAYQQAADCGAEQVIALVMSSRLSGAFHHAQAGAQLVNFPVFVQDTWMVSMAEGFCVLAGSELCRLGMSVDVILDGIRQTRRGTRLFFTVDTLDYLHRGGRISGLQHRIGSALSFKPIFCLDEGQIQLVEHARSRARAIRRMLELALEAVPAGEPVRAAVVHGDALAEASALAETVEAAWSPLQLMITPVSAAIGVHTGPGVLGLALSPC
jgi:DegV family protein with EDD domain